MGCQARGSTKFWWRALNQSCLPPVAELLFLLLVVRGWMEVSGIRRRQQLYVSLSAVRCLGKPHWAKKSASTYSNPSRPFSAFLVQWTRHVQQVMAFTHWVFPIKLFQWALKNTIGLCSNRCCIKWNMLQNYIACICVKGINVTNQDSQLKYDESHRAKERGIKRLKEDRKQGG